MVSTHRSDQIRYVDHQQRDIAQYEEESEESDEVRREPQREELYESIPLWQRVRESGNDSGEVIVRSA